MAWYDGELFPVAREFERAPVGATSPGGECMHDHVVAPHDASQSVPVTQGKTVLMCLDCSETWWEDVALIQGSPWAGK